MQQILLLYRMSEFRSDWIKDTYHRRDAENAEPRIILLFAERAKSKKAPVGINGSLLC